MHIFIHSDYWRKIYSPIDCICEYYYISRDCDIYSEYSGLILKPVICENGYIGISLNTNDGQRIQRKVHRLGMMTFHYVDGCEFLQVNHIDGNKLNNNVDTNLEWVTPKQNISHAINSGLRKSWENDCNPKAKLTSDQVAYICKMILDGFSDEQIILKYPFINSDIIRSIVYGRTWTSFVNENVRQSMINVRTKIILTTEQKHALCKYYESNHFIKTHKGDVKNYIISSLYACSIDINDSTFRIAKRLFYKYQDFDITSKYNY